MPKSALTAVALVVALIVAVAALLFVFGAGTRFPILGAATGLTISVLALAVAIAALLTANRAP